MLKGQIQYRPMIFQSLSPILLCTLYLPPPSHTSPFLIPIHSLLVHEHVSPDYTEGWVLIKFYVVELLLRLDIYNQGGIYYISFLFCMGYA